MEKTANPAPLGLMGFGMTTVLLNIHNAGFFPISSMILAMGLFYGGIAQIIAGILEFRKGNTFGMTAFVSYGTFWITLVGLIVGPRTGWVDRTPEGFMGWFLVMWGIFTLFMFFGTLRANRALQFVFLSLTVLFFLLAIRDFAASPTVGVVAGWEGIVCGASAIYLAMAEVLSEQFGRDILPIGRPKAVTILSALASLPAAVSREAVVNSVS
jgi:succinate-acetate transporter protein